MKRLLILFVFAQTAFGQQSNWINVVDYGAKATYGTDDTPAISAAIQAALLRISHRDATVVYFPKQGDGAIPRYYQIMTPLELPQANRRITLYFDSGVWVFATITVHGGYTLHGTESGNPGFGTTGVQLFEPGYNLNPVIHIQGAGVKLQNLSVGSVHGGDGIVVDNSSDVRLENVNVEIGADNPAGIPLKLMSGFRYQIVDGGYSSSGAPAIQMSEGPNTCTTAGDVSMKNVFFGGFGIQILNHCGFTSGISIDGALLEDASKAFLTAIVTGGAPIFGVELRNVHMADSAANLPPLIDAQCPNGLGSNGFCMANVQIVNSSADGIALTTGDPIWNLEVWSQIQDYVSGTIAQPDHFIYHGPRGIKDTMPRLP